MHHDTVRWWSKRDVLFGIVNFTQTINLHFMQHCNPQNCILQIADQENMETNGRSNKVWFPKCSRTDANSGTLGGRIDALAVPVKLFVYCVCERTNVFVVLDPTFNCSFSVGDQTIKVVQNSKLS